MNQTQAQSGYCLTSVTFGPSPGAAANRDKRALLARIYSPLLLAAAAAVAAAMYCCCIPIIIALNWKTFIVIIVDIERMRPTISLTPAAVPIFSPSLDSQPAPGREIVA